MNLHVEIFKSLGRLSFDLERANSIRKKDEAPVSPRISWNRAQVEADNIKELLEKITLCLDRFRVIERRPHLSNHYCLGIEPFFQSFDKASGRCKSDF